MSTRSREATSQPSSSCLPALQSSTRWCCLRLRPSLSPHGWVCRRRLCRAVVQPLSAAAAAAVRQCVMAMLAHLGSHGLDLFFCQSVVPIQVHASWCAMQAHPLPVCLACVQQSSRDLPIRCTQFDVGPSTADHVALLRPLLLRAQLRVRGTHLRAALHPHGQPQAAEAPPCPRASVAGSRGAASPACLAPPAPGRRRARRCCLVHATRYGYLSTLRPRACTLPSPWPGVDHVLLLHLHLPGAGSQEGIHRGADRAHHPADRASPVP